MEIRPAWFLGDTFLRNLLVRLALAILCLGFPVQTLIPLKQLGMGWPGSFDTLDSPEMDLFAHLRLGWVEGRVAYLMEEARHAS